jgi:hypothetical protein
MKVRAITAVQRKCRYTTVAYYWYVDVTRDAEVWVFSAVAICEVVARIKPWGPLQLILDLLRIVIVGGSLPGLQGNREEHRFCHELRTREQKPTTLPRVPALRQRANPA